MDEYIKIRVCDEYIYKIKSKFKYYLKKIELEIEGIICNYRNKNMSRFFKNLNKIQEIIVNTLQRIDMIYNIECIEEAIR